jgi:hypothetical protein
MESQFGLYPQFYVKRKDLLFPLIEKYLGISMKGKTHGDAIETYLRLLKTNEGFRNEVDNAIATKGFNNAGGVGLSAIVSIFGGLFGSKEGEANADASFYQAVAAVQQEDDSSKILIISVVTLLVVGIGVVIFVKMKK